MYFSGTRDWPPTVEVVDQTAGGPRIPRKGANNPSAAPIIVFFDVLHGLQSYEPGRGEGAVEIYPTGDTGKRAVGAADPKDSLRVAAT